jgi:hypothetical protein
MGSNKSLTMDYDGTICGVQPVSIPLSAYSHVARADNAAKDIPRGSSLVGNSI